MEFPVESTQKVGVFTCLAFIMKTAFNSAISLHKLHIN